MLSPQFLTLSNSRIDLAVRSSWGLEGGRGAPELNFFEIDLLQISFVHAHDEFLLWLMWFLNLKRIEHYQCRWMWVYWCWRNWYEDCDSWSQFSLRTVTILEVCDYGRTPFINWKLGYFAWTAIIIAVPILKLCFYEKSDHNHSLNKNSKIRHFCEDSDHRRSPNKEDYIMIAVL